jgi:pyroglutamyl-peptidase
MGTVATDLLLDEAASEPRLGGRQGAAVARTRVTEFHCTAFGKFHGVSVNPTELIIRSLPEHLAAAPLPACATIASATVMEVAAKSSRTLLERMHGKVAPLPPPRKTPQSLSFQHSSHMSTVATPASPVDAMAAVTASKAVAERAAHRVVFVHFGVNVGVKRFELETQGFNEATFSCPDEAGWAPVKAAIDPDASLPLAHARRTKLPLQLLTNTLQGHGFDVGVSADAGRFVCNWVYYNSLRLSETNGSLALFVHVPDVTTVPLQRQLEFCSALLTAIADLECCER